jgi:hypothetical protein
MHNEDTFGSTLSVEYRFEHVECVDFHGCFRVPFPSVESGLSNDTNSVATDVAEVECVDPLGGRSSSFVYGILFGNEDAID